MIYISFNLRPVSSFSVSSLFVFQSETNRGVSVRVKSFALVSRLAVGFRYQKTVHQTKQVVLKIFDSTIEQDLFYLFLI